MTRYIWDGETFVPADEYRRPESKGPFIMSDIPEYMSPTGAGMITSRSQRREDLRSSGCREVDPSEFKPQFHNRRFAKKHGREWSGMTDHPTHRSNRNEGD